MTKILLKLVLFCVAGALSVLFSVELISQISGVAVWNSAARINLYKPGHGCLEALL